MRLTLSTKFLKLFLKLTYARTSITSFRRLDSFAENKGDCPLFYSSLLSNDLQRLLKWVGDGVSNRARVSTDSSVKGDSEKKTARG